MAQIVSFFALLLVTGGLCAPHEIGGGFRVGGVSRGDVSAGASGVITRDGLLFTGEGEGMVGAKWRGGAYGGGFANLDDHYFAARGAAETNVGASVDGGLNGKIGMNGENKFPLGLHGRLEGLKQAEIGANGKIATGAHGNRMSHLYRSSEFENPHMNFD